MKIIQVIPTLSLGDAVGNDARAVCKVISEMGYKTRIYAENIDHRLHSPKFRKISRIPRLSDDDIVIFNHSTGTELCELIPKLGGRKMMIYHNITPPRFFEPYDKVSARLAQKGYENTRSLKDKIDYVMAVSEYNADDLRKMGYKCPIYVRPILIPFDGYRKFPDNAVIKKHSDGYTNIIFVGRLAPNKKQEDIIAVFAYYKKNVNPKSRLLIVGGGNEGEYASALRSYVEALGLHDVVFTGHVSFRALLAFYRVADLFLCMSEHEGFCVPLVEAMFFDIPIIAYDSSAISETLRKSGILIDDKNPVFVSMLIDRVMKDKGLRKYVLAKQRKRLMDFSYENIKSLFVNGLNDFINDNSRGENEDISNIT